jgi:hypothetical protein
MYRAASVNLFGYAAYWVYHDDVRQAKAKIGGRATQLNVSIAIVVWRILRV